MDFKDGVTRAVAAMEKTVSQAFGTMTSQEKRFESAMSSAASAVASMEAKVGKAHSAMANYQSRYRKEIQDTNQAMRESNSLAGELRSTLAGFATVGFLAGIGKQALETGAEMQQTRVAFETFIGDTEKATKLLGELKIWADYSPFDLRQTNEAGQALLAAGVNADKLIATMNVLGDISQGNMNKFQMVSLAYGKMLGEGWADTRHLTEIAVDAGVPIFAQLKKMGYSRDKIKEGGGVSLEVLQRAMMAMTTGDGHFSNMMEKQGQTLIGRWGTLMGALQTESIKAFDKLQPYLASMVEWGINIIPKVHSAMKSLWEVMKGVGAFLYDHREMIKGIAIVVGALVGWYYLYQGAMMASAALTYGLAAAQGVLATAQYLMTGGTIEGAAAWWGLNTAMLANPVFWVLGGIMALTAGIIYAWNHFEKFRVLMYALWATIKQVFSNIGDFFKSIFEPIFKAIEAFKAGHYGEAAKQVGIMAFNLSPAGLAYQATKFTAGGGLTNGVADAWTGGKQAGHQSWLDSQKKEGRGGLLGMNPLKDHNLFGDKYNKAAGGEGEGKGHKEGTSHRNVTVTIMKLVGIENVHVNSVAEATAIAADKVTTSMIGAVRDFETGVAVAM